MSALSIYADGSVGCELIKNDAVEWHRDPAECAWLYIILYGKP